MMSEPKYTTREISLHLSRYALLLRSMQFRIEVASEIAGHSHETDLALEQQAKEVEDLAIYLHNAKEMI